MLYQIKTYFNFLLHSQNQHGVHSPFVYDLVTKCFYDKKVYPEYQRLKKHRTALRKDNSTISMTDFGAGSRVFRSNIRKISSIARTAGVRKRDQKLLFRLARYFSSENILELGTSLGLGSAGLALSHPKASVTTVEGCPETSSAAQRYFENFQLNNIQSETKTFEDFLQEDSNENYDLIYIDGNHSKERTLAYFEALLPKTHKGSFMIFDDIYWNKEMTEAWNIIRRQLVVTVSIDAYNWGLIFFRKEQPKQHFRIRL